MAKQPDKEPSALLSADKLSTKEKTETRRRSKLSSLIAHFVNHITPKEANF